MNAQPAPSAAVDACGYELRFRSLFAEGRGYAFPCDASGRVDLERLSERARASYQRVRAIVGIELAAPAVTLAVLH